MSEQVSESKELIFPLLSDENTKGTDDKDAWDSRETLVYEEAQVKNNSFFEHYIGSRIQAGSVKGSMFTLTTAIVGAGILALPYALQQVGLALGVILLVGGGLLCLFSLHILIICSGYANVMSYEGLALYSAGPKAAKIAQICICLNLFGTSVGYLVGGAELIPLTVKAITGKDEYGVLTDRSFVLSLLCVVFVLPLSLFRRLGVTRYTSLFAIICVTYLTLVAVIKCFELSSVEKIKNLPLFDIRPNRILTAVPLVVFAYTCHPIVLPVYIELQRRSAPRMYKVLRRCILIAELLYVSLAVAVFATFGADTQQNFLNNDYHKDPFVLLGCCMFSFAVVITIPVFVHTLRTQINEIIWQGSYMTTIKHISVTVLLVSMMLLFCTTTRNIATVLRILGATSNPIICFVYPAIFICRIAPPNYLIQKVVALLVAVVLIIVSVLSLINQIHPLVG